MTKDQEEDLVRRLKLEGERLGTFEIPVLLDTTSALYLVGLVQVALRHPGIDGQAAQVGKATADGLIEWMRVNGMPAHAACAQLGYGVRCGHCGMLLLGSEEAATHRCEVVA